MEHATAKKIKNENKAMMKCVPSDSMMNQSPSVDIGAEPCSNISKPFKLKKDSVFGNRTENELIRTNLKIHLISKLGDYTS